MRCAFISQKKQFSAPEISDLEDLFSLLLEKRNLNNHEEIQKFLNPSLINLHDPWQMKDMKKSVSRILSAINQKERIMVVGDFDTDGITATVTLVEGLKNLGAEISYRIPKRQIDSHGLKKHILDDIAESGATLVITCDCGTNDREEIMYGKKLGLDIIITDHHEILGDQFAHNAFSVLNPRQPNCPYPEKNLSGSAVAFKLLSALGEKTCDTPESLAEFLGKFFEICAIGLIADCVPLTGENRILAQFGLEKLKTTSWKGLQKMLEKCSIDPRNIDEETVGYVIAPRLNAASRVGDVSSAVQLFLGDSTRHYEHLTTLHQLNEKRKKMTEKAVKESETQIDPTASCQVIFHHEWEPGILGLIAGRNAERFHVPVFAASVRTDGVLVSSARAPKGYSVVEGLQECGKLFQQFGGHDGAGGFTADPKMLKSIRLDLQKYFSSLPTKTQNVLLDAWISPKLITNKLSEFLHVLSPFGSGNEPPILGLKNVEVLDYQSMGNGNNHLRFIGKCQGKILHFTAFFAENLLQQMHIGKQFNVLFSLSENWWNGEKRLQLRVKDIREHQ